MTKVRILMALAVDTIIALVVTTGLSYNDPQHWFGYLYSALIFSYSIGFSIFGLVHYFSPRFERFPVIVRIGGMTGVFVVGGIFGTEVALGIFYVFFRTTFSAASHTRMLQFNLILSVIFGTIAVLYFSLRERARQLGAALKEKELNEERLTRLKTKAELEALQSKINPHFLFNTLNSIASLISENPKAAEETVEKLSELFRHSLRHSEKSTVTLAEELDLIRTYLEIEKVRLGDRLQYDVKCEDSIRDAELPAMLIQPLVENSIKHGIASAINGGTISVEAKKVDGVCVITVSDSGKGFEDASDSSGFGLRSIQDRLRLLYGDKASLEVVQNGCCKIVITFPLR
jgi:two-component system LytT family sensor kinase